MNAPDFYVDLARRQAEPRAFLLDRLDAAAQAEGGGSDGAEGEAQARKSSIGDALPSAAAAVEGERAPRGTGQDAS